MTDQSIRTSGRALPKSPRKQSGARGQRGAEILEFTLVLLPLLAMVTVLVSTAWAVFVKSTLQRAVRMGVRTGVTITAQQAPPGSCLTDMVKQIVQQNAFGLLTGGSNLSKIKVNYLQPPAASSAGPAVDVSNQLTGNASGNIMQVSVQGFSLVPLVPRIFDWNKADNSPLVFSVYSADRIEPSRDPPCIGVAP
jgi:Flp pilus assembly protein TadG